MIQTKQSRFPMPSVHHMMKTDPLGFDAGDGNLYRYVGNNPTNLIDPTGLWEMVAKNVYSRGNDDIDEKDKEDRSDFEVAVITIALEKEIKGQDTNVRLVYTVYSPPDTRETIIAGSKYYLHETKNSLKPDGKFQTMKLQSLGVGTSKLQAIIDLGVLPKEDCFAKGSLFVISPEADGSVDPKTTTGDVQTIVWCIQIDNQKIKGDIHFWDEGFGDKIEGKRPGNEIIRLIESSYIPKGLWKKPFPTRAV